MSDAKSFWEQVANGFRWVAFIPGGLLAGMLASVLVGIFAALLSWFHNELNWGPIASSIALGYVPVVAAAWIAPTPKKLIPAMSMAMVLCLFYGVMILVNIAEREWWVLANCVVAVVATGFALHHFILESHKPVATPLPEVKTESLREKYPALFEDKDDSFLADLESEDDEAKSPLAEAVH